MRTGVNIKRECVVCVRELRASKYNAQMCVCGSYQPRNITRNVCVRRYKPRYSADPGAGENGRVCTQGRMCGQVGGYLRQVDLGPDLLSDSNRVVRTGTRAYMVFFLYSGDIYTYIHTWLFDC